MEILFDMITKEHGIQGAADVLGTSGAGRYASKLESKKEEFNNGFVN